MRLIRTTRGAGTAVCLAALLSSAAVPAQNVKTILTNGPTTNRYDIVILGDGYQAHEESRFDSDAKAVIAALFATEPYKTFQHLFNAHTVFRASKESGADHPDRSPPVVKDTAYDATYAFGGTGRCVYIKNTSQALRDAALAPSTEGRVMVIVNDGRYGGCAGTFTVTYNGTSMQDVQVHEFGHSFAGLADEYDYPNGTYTGPEPGAKNITAQSSGNKWAKWLGFGGVSAYEGAGYYQRGLWRPRANCVMRNLGQPLCPVCAEQTVISTYVAISGIDDPKPALARVAVDSGVKQTFSFTNIVPSGNNPTVTWKLDGVPQPTTTPSLTVDTKGLAFGDHAVTAEVQDNTALVRADPGARLNSKHTWTLHIKGPPFPDYVPVWFACNKTVVPAGDKIDLNNGIKNAGFTPGPAVVGEHFLSTDKVLTTADHYIGSHGHPALGIGQADVRYRTGVTVPAHLPPGNYHLALVLDRQDSIKEVDENNNIAWLPLTVTVPPCPARLTYAEPLNHPPDGFRISGTLGGSARLAVTAPCHAGAGYLLLLGLSGTTPGTPVGAAGILPLNIDAYSELFYLFTNSTFATNFLGTLDPSGRAIATLNLPGSMVTGSVTAHLAAIVFDPKTGAFQNPSDAVRLDITP